VVRPHTKGGHLRLLYFDRRVTYLSLPHRTKLAWYVRRRVQKLTEETARTCKRVKSCNIVAQDREEIMSRKTMSI
jgi:hypothetical protein